MNPTAFEHERAFQEKYGFATKHIAGCMVGESLMRYARDYNAVMEAEFDRVYGPGACVRCWEDIRTNRQAK